MIFNWLFGKKKPEPKTVKKEAYSIDFRNSELPSKNKWKKWDMSKANQSVAGVTHRLDEVEWFISGAITAEEKGQGQYGVHLVREQSSQYDKNAIQVWGWLNEPRNKKQIGYLKKDEAKSIAKDLPPGTPLSAELIRLFMPESRIPWIGIQVVIPKTVEATKFNPATQMQKEFYRYFNLKIPKSLSYEDAGKFIAEQPSNMTDEWNAFETLFEEINDPEIREDYGIKKIGLSLYRSVIDKLKTEGKTLTEPVEDYDIDADIVIDLDVVIDKAIEMNPELEKK